MVMAYLLFEVYLLENKKENMRQSLSGPISNIIMDYEIMMSKSWDVKCMHVYREQNRLAEDMDGLVSFGSRKRVTGFLQTSDESPGHLR